VEDLPDTAYRRTLDRYALYGEIAAGGMARVHYGRVLGAQSVPRVVAIKCLLPELAVDPTFVRMFLAEGRLASRIRHPNVVATHDVVSLPAGAEGSPGQLFHVMEYVAGKNLEDRLTERQGPDPGRALVEFAALADGLAHAHDLGIHHRDIKAENVVVDSTGRAVLVDFGVALHLSASRLTKAGNVMGTMVYLPPEVLEGGAPDGASHDNTRRAQRFARQLRGRFGLPVYEVDERYSTTEALAANARDADAASACIILEQFLRSLS